MASLRDIGYFQYQMDRVGEICKQRNWKKDWSSGGCYIHLEVSEFIESLRGKGGKPVEEAADVIITLMAVLDHYQIRAIDLLPALEDKLEKLEEGSIGRVGNE